MAVRQRSMWLGWAVSVREASHPATVTGTGTSSPTNELARHMFFIVLLARIFGFAPAPLLIGVFAMHAVSMLVPYRMPRLIRSLTKSATAAKSMLEFLANGEARAFAAESRRVTRSLATELTR